MMDCDALWSILASWSLIFNLLVLILVMASRSDIKPQQRVIRKVRRRISEPSLESPQQTSDSTSLKSIWRNSLPVISDHQSWSKMETPNDVDTNEETMVEKTKDQDLSLNHLTVEELSESKKMEELSESKKMEERSECSNELNNGFFANSEFELPEDDIQIKRSDPKMNVAHQELDEQHSTPCNQDKIGGLAKLISSGNPKDSVPISESTLVNDSILGKSALNSTKLNMNDSVDSSPQSSTPMMSFKELNGRIKIIPLLPESINETTNLQEELDTQVFSNLTKSVLNDLSMGHSQKPGGKLRIIPSNIEASVSDTSSINHSIASDTDSGCFLNPVTSEDGSKRVSVSEPLAAPPGYTILATTMEIGLVRDVVFQVVLFHEKLIQGEGVVSKTYVLVCNCADVGIASLKQIEVVYKGVCPEVLVRGSEKIKFRVWQKWVQIDEGMSARVSDKLQAWPFFRKSCGDVLTDLQKTRIGGAVFATAGKIFGVFGRTKTICQD